MWLRATEEIGKYKTHYKKSQKGREHAPYHAEIGTLVFLFKISLYQLGEQESVLLEFFYRS